MAGGRDAQQEQGPMSASAAAPPGRRRRGWVVTVAVIAALVLVVAGLIVADAVARQQARAAIAGQLQRGLGLDAPPQVELGGVSFLAQLATGRLESLQAQLPDARLGSITGDLRISAQGVPLSGHGALSSASLTLAVPADQLEQLLSQASPVPLDSVALGNGSVTLGTSLDLLGVPVPVSLVVVPELQGTALRLRPDSVSVGGLQLNAQQLQARLGDAASALTAGVSLCLADRIPAGVHPQSVVVTPAGVRLDATIDPLILDDPALTRPGAC